MFHGQTTDSLTGLECRREPLMRSPCSINVSSYLADPHRTRGQSSFSSSCEHLFYDPFGFPITHANRDAGVINRYFLQWFARVKLICNMS